MIGSHPSTTHVPTLTSKPIGYPVHGSSTPHLTLNKHCFCFLPIGSAYTKCQNLSLPLFLQIRSTEIAIANHKVILWVCTPELGLSFFWDWPEPWSETLPGAWTCGAQGEKIMQSDPQKKAFKSNLDKGFHPSWWHWMINPEIRVPQSVRF